MSEADLSNFTLKRDKTHGIAKHLPLNNTTVVLEVQSGV